MSPMWWSLLIVSVVACGMLEALPIDSDSSSVMANLETQESSFGVQPSNEGRALVRDKRTIGILRQLFPTLSQIIDRKIQAITKILFRVIGRLILRGAAGGGGGGGGTDSDSSGGDDGRRISITLPTFPPSADDEEEEEEGTTDSDSSTPGADDSTTTTTEPSDTDNTVSESRLVPVLVRKARQAQAEEEQEEEDQAAEATGDNELEESEDADTAESVENPEDPRDKRLVNFNLGGSGGSGGGSGNFLFDIIRLVAGSGTTQAEDEANNAPLEDGNVTANGDDGYSAGVPGPLTRLFVIANRGIANLIQDLILRLAQTSERIVNFKARLITSII